MPRPRKRSSSSSRRPADSAAISTRAGLAPICASSAAAGCSARGSMRTEAGAALAKFCTGPAVSGGHSKERSCNLRARHRMPCETPRAPEYSSAGSRIGRWRSWRNCSWRSTMALHTVSTAGAGLVQVDQCARGRQILEQMRGAVEEQRQEELQAARRLSGAHVAVHRLLGQVAREAQAVAAAKFPHRVGIERCFPGGQQRNALQLVARALAVGVEVPDAVDVAVQQVDAVRRVRAHREHVEQGAADRKFAMGDHLGHRGVAGQRQPGTQGIEIQGFADMHLQ